MLLGSGPRSLGEREEGHNDAQSPPSSNHPFHCWSLIFLSRTALTLGLYPGVGRVLNILDIPDFLGKEVLFRDREKEGYPLVSRGFTF